VSAKAWVFLGIGDIAVGQSSRVNHSFFPQKRLSNPIPLDITKSSSSSRRAQVVTPARDLRYSQVTISTARKRAFREFLIDFNMFIKSFIISFSLFVHVSSEKEMLVHNVVFHFAVFYAEVPIVYQKLSP
jgi:hypothetical protein